MIHANATWMEVSVETLGRGRVRPAAASRAAGLRAVGGVISWTHRELHTKSPFGIARWTHSTYPRSFVTFEQGGMTGRGEAAPNAYYGETGETVKVIGPLLEGALSDPWDWQGLQADLAAPDAAGPPQRQVRAGNGGAGLVRRLGGPAGVAAAGLVGSAIPESSYTVSLAELPEMRRQARDAWDRGHTILKVKLGTPQDQQIVEALREEVPQAKLRVDANAAWSRAAGPADAGGAGSAGRGTARAAAGGGRPGGARGAAGVRAAADHRRREPAPRFRRAPAGRRFRRHQPQDRQAGRAAASARRRCERRGRWGWASWSAA